MEPDPAPTPRIKRAYHRRAPRELPVSAVEDAALTDPLAALRAVGVRLATHRALLDAADALSLDDRALVTALARRLAAGRIR